MHNRLYIDILWFVEFNFTCRIMNILYKMSLEYPRRQCLPEVASNYVTVEQQSMLHLKRTFRQRMLAVSRTAQTWLPICRSNVSSSVAISDLWSWCPNVKYCSLQFCKQLCFSSFLEQNITSTHNPNYLIFEIGILLEMSIKNVIEIS